MRIYFIIISFILLFPHTNLYAEDRASMAQMAQMAGMFGQGMAMLMCINLMQKAQQSGNSTDQMMAMMECSQAAQDKSGSNSNGQQASQLGQNQPQNPLANNSNGQNQNQNPNLLNNPQSIGTGSSPSTTSPSLTSGTTPSSTFNPNPSLTVSPNGGNGPNSNQPATTQLPLIGSQGSSQNGTNPLNPPNGLANSGGGMGMGMGMMGGYGMGMGMGMNGGGLSGGGGSAAGGSSGAIAQGDSSPLRSLSSLLSSNITPGGMGVGGGGSAIDSINQSTGDAQSQNLLNQLLGNNQGGSPSSVENISLGLVSPQNIQSPNGEPGGATNIFQAASLMYKKVTGKYIPQGKDTQTS